MCAMERVEQSTHPGKIDHLKISFHLSSGYLDRRRIFGIKKMDFL